MCTNQQQQGRAGQGQVSRQRNGGTLPVCRVLLLNVLGELLGLLTGHIHATQDLAELLLAEHKLIVRVLDAVTGQDFTQVLALLLDLVGFAERQVVVPAEYTATNDTQQT